MLEPLSFLLPFYFCVTTPRKAIEFFDSVTCFLFVSENTEHQAQSWALGSLLYSIKLSCTRDEEELEKACKTEELPVLLEINMA